MKKLGRRFVLHSRGQTFGCIIKKGGGQYGIYTNYYSNDFFLFRLNDADDTGKTFKNYFESNFECGNWLCGDYNIKHSRIAYRNQLYDSTFYRAFGASGNGRTFYIMYFFVIQWLTLFAEK